MSRAYQSYLSDENWEVLKLHLTLPLALGFPRLYPRRELQQKRQALTGCRQRSRTTSRGAPTAATPASRLDAGIFPTDPVSGYPPGAPNRLSGYSWHGALHDGFSLPTFLALTAACFVFGRWSAARGERGWAAYSAATGVAFVVAFVLSSAEFGKADGLVDLAELFQRAAVTAGFGWLAVLAAHLLWGVSEPPNR